MSPFITKRRTEAKKSDSLVMPLAVENILGKKLFTTESKKYNKSQLLLKKKREVGKANKNRMVSFNSSFTDYTF